MPAQRREVVHLWNRGAHGATSVSRTVDVPAFPEIEAN
jgi:hypothetical protein